MAPFWDDINIDDGGTISYETFESGYYLEQVNAYIQRQRQNAFQGTWMMNVYYKEVAPYSVSGGDSRRVSFSLCTLLYYLSKSVAKLNKKHVSFYRPIFGGRVSSVLPMSCCPTHYMS